MRKAMGIAVLCLGAGGFAAAPAEAQMYWSLEAGWSLANDADFKDKDSTSPFIACVDILCTMPGTLNNLDDSYIVGAGIGYRFSPALRADVMLTYRGGYSLDDRDETDTHSDADLVSTALMVNGYYDFRADGVRPYLGLGIGRAQNELDPLLMTFPADQNSMATSYGAKKSDIAFALMAGMGIPFSGWILDLGYRYTDLGEFETGAMLPVFLPSTGASGELTAHELTAGMRF